MGFFSCTLVSRQCVSRAQGQNVHQDDWSCFHSERIVLDLNGTLRNADALLPDSDLFCKAHQGHFNVCIKIEKPLIQQILKGLRKRNIVLLFLKESNYILYICIKSLNLQAQEITERCLLFSPQIQVDRKYFISQKLFTL